MRCHASACVGAQPGGSGALAERARPRTATARAPPSSYMMVLTLMVGLGSPHGKPQQTVLLPCCGEDNITCQAEPLPSGDKASKATGREVSGDTPPAKTGKLSTLCLN